MFKNLLVLFFSIYASIASANPLASNADVNINVSVQPSCFFESPLFFGNFGSIPSGEVGMTGVEIALICSHSSAYTIKPINDQATKTGGYNENLILKAYKNSAFSDPLTTTNVITSTGTGTTQRMTIYFKLTGKGKDFGNGNGVVEKFDFSNNAFVYPIAVVY